MVDAAVPVRELRSARAEAGASKAFSPAWAISYGDGEAFAGYRRLADDAVVSPTQSAGWVSAWVENVRPDWIFASARIAGVPVMGLALEIVARGPFKMASFMGGSHACGNFPPVLRGFPAERDSEIMQSLVRALREARPDIDILALERLTDEIDGVRNPLLALPSLPSPNVALAVRLDGGFDELLKRASGKRKKKKHRWQMRKFEAAGAFRRFEAKTPDEVERILEAFFAMKETRLAKKGIKDVFDTPEVRAFFRGLFTNALKEKQPPFLLHALEVGDTLRAVSGSSVEGKRLICEFGAIVEDELAHASPGDYLFFDNIHEACDQGYEIYDFSIGDEPYKRLWCDIESWQRDAYQPLTARGFALAAIMRAKNRVKSFVKNSPLVWKFAKALRKQKAAPREDGDE